MGKTGLFVVSDTGVGAGIDFTNPNSALARYYLKLGHCLGICLLCLVFVGLNFSRVWHTDIWAHVRFGDRLLETRTFPAGEPFSPFGDKDAGVSYGPWLSQVIYAAAFRAGASFAGGDELNRLAGGTDALRFLHALAVTARLGLLYLAFVRTTNASGLGAIGVALTIAIGLGSFGVARPQVFAELAFAGLLAIVSGPEITKFGVAAIVVVMVAWANLQGTFPVGFVFLGGLWVGRCISQVWDHGWTWSKITSTRLVLAIAISLVAVAFLNPEGPRTFLSAVRMANHPNVKLMGEWQPIHAPLAFGARLALAACLLALVVALIFYRRVFDTESCLLLTLFFVPTLFHQRGVVWFTSVSMWIAVRYYGLARERFQPDWWGSVPSFRKTIVAAAMIVLAIAYSVPVLRWLDGKPMPLAKAFSEATPWQLALAIRDPALALDTPLAKELAKSYPGGKFIGTIFATEVLGDFFVWEAPKADVFMYSHVHLFTPERWQEYTQIRLANKVGRQIVDSARINLVVVAAESNPQLCQWLRKDPNWVVLVDESVNLTKADPRARLFAALRQKPR